MLVSYAEIERMTDLFTLGAYFLFMLMGACRFFKHSRNHLHRVTAWVLVWWTFLVFDGYIGYLFPFGSEASVRYDRFANVLDMTVVVGVVMIGYALTYARKVSWGFMIFQSIPYCIFLAAVVFTDEPAWEMIAFVWTILYSTFYFVFFGLQLRSYIARVHAVYSNDTARNLYWLRNLMFVFFGMVVVWAIPTYLHIVGTYVVFYVSSIVLWWIALDKIEKQKPVNIRYLMGDSNEDLESKEDENIVEADNANLDVVADEDDEDNPVVTDRRYAFAPRLEVMFEEEQIYLQPDLNINELARMLGTNRAYLSAYLNNVKEVSFFDYVNSWRLRRAENMLVTTNDTIDLIADNCGFNNTYSFRRVFVKSFDCTPTEWRHLRPDERRAKMPKWY